MTAGWLKDLTDSLAQVSRRIPLRFQLIDLLAPLVDPMIANTHAEEKKEQP